MNYLNILKLSAEHHKSVVCMGLDPVLKALPEKYQKHGIEGVPGYYESIFEEMLKQKVIPGAIKPNHGFYIVHDNLMSADFSGSRALDKVIDTIKCIFPDVPVILDFKRGDIANSSKNYAEEGFTGWCADAVTVSPFMGADSVEPFINYCNDANGRGVYVLNRTSNAGAHDLQDLLTLTPQNVKKIEGAYEDATLNFRKVFESEILHAAKPIYIKVAEKIIEWAKEKPGVGAVVGATSPKELSDIVSLYAGKDIPLLIPGVGGQGGSAQEVSMILRDAGYDLRLARINSSSGLTHPWAGKKEQAPNDFAAVCTEALRKLNEEIGYPESK